MGNKNIDVDFDASDLDDDEIVDDLIRRIESRTHFKLSESDAMELLQVIKDNYNLSGIQQPDRTSLEDEMKSEHLNKVWNSYTSFEMEKLLPEK